MKLTKLHWLSALVIFSLISGMVIHLMVSSNDVPLNSVSLNDTAPGYISSSTGSDISQEHATALMMKLAELQSHVLRLNALGDRLAEEANISDQEFNFNQQPPSGGPISAENTAASQHSIFDIQAELINLANSLNYEEKQLAVLESLSLGHHIENTAYLSGRPITKGWLSSSFGIRKDPFHGKPSMHKGVDFAGKEDAAIIATAAGVVTWADERYGYGNLVEINHGQDLKTRYGHNKEILVNVGDVVSKGQIIARMGSTGRSTGPHVHYEILKKNKQVDPIQFVYRTAK